MWLPGIPTGPPLAAPVARPYFTEDADDIPCHATAELNLHECSEFTTCTLDTNLEIDLDGKVKTTVDYFRNMRGSSGRGGVQ